MRRRETLSFTPFKRTPVCHECSEVLDQAFDVTFVSGFTNKEKATIQTVAKERAAKWHLEPSSKTTSDSRARTSRLWRATSTEGRLTKILLDIFLRHAVG